MKRWLTFLFLTVVWLLSVDVMAQGKKKKPEEKPATEEETPAPPPPTTPRELALEGIGLYEAGNYQEAADKIQRAEEGQHSVINTLYLARALVKLGRPKDAHAYYAMTATENLPNWAPRQSVEAQHEAAKEAAELRKKLGCARVVVRGGEVKSVRIDNNEVAVANLYLPIALDRGPHRIEVDGEHGSVYGDVAVPAQGTATLELMLPQPKPVPGADGESDASSEPSQVPVYIAYGLYGLGGALGITGAILGLVAFVNAEDLKDQCETQRCGLFEQVDANATNSMADISTGLLIVAGAHIATAVVLHVVFGGSDQEAVEAEVALEVTPTGLVLEGRF